MASEERADLVDEILQVERIELASLLATSVYEAVEHDYDEGVQGEEEKDDVEHEVGDAGDTVRRRQVAQVEVAEWNTQQRVAVGSDTPARSTEEASTHKNAKAHAGNVAFVTRESRL